MNERRARRTVTRQEAGGQRPLTTAVFAPITGGPFPLFPAVSLYREPGMGHPDAVHPPPAVSPYDHRVRVYEESGRGARLGSRSATASPGCSERWGVWGAMSGPPIKKVQMRGGARRPHARRTPCTLSVRPRAPTKQMGLFQQPAATRGAGSPGV